MRRDGRISNLAGRIGERVNRMPVRPSSRRRWVLNTNRLDFIVNLLRLRPAQKLARQKTLGEPDRGGHGGPLVQGLRCFLPLFMDTRYLLPRFAGSGKIAVSSGARQGMT